MFVSVDSSLSQFHNIVDPIQPIGRGDIPEDMMGPLKATL